jgi:hypothetical protein
MASRAGFLLAAALAYQAPNTGIDFPSIAFDATGSCVTATSTSPLYSPPAYQLQPDGSVPSGVVANAEAAWNSSGCNTNGTAFPLLTPNAITGSKPVTVSYVSGLNPSNNQECGNTKPSGPSSYRITLYSQARLDTGVLVSCGNTAIITQSLEHEIGHLLDLADSNCPGYIMSQVAFSPQTGSAPPQPATRTIQPAECAEANQMNITPAEQPPPPPPPPPTQCPPTCTCPPTCQNGCDANGVCKDDPCTTDPTLPQCNGEGGPGGVDPCGGDDPCDDGGIVTVPLPPVTPPAFGSSGSMNARKCWYYSG